MVFASSGRLPFAGDTMTAIVGRILHGEPDLGALTGPLRDLAVRCLAKDPAMRPPASEVLRVLLGEAPAAPVPQARPVPQAVPVPPAPQAVPVPPAPGEGPTMRMPSGAVPAAPAGKRAERRSTALIAVSAAVVAVAVAAVVVAVLRPWQDGGATTAEAGTRDGDAPPAAAGESTSAPSARAPASSGSSTAESRRTGIPGRYAGTWTGRVTQNDGKVFPITLVLPAGGGAGKVSYPLQNCSGTETFLRRTGDTLVFREQITFGTERCVDTGSVSLTPETGGDRLMFRYSGTSPNGRRWTVAGPLSRS